MASARFSPVLAAALALFVSTTWANPTSRIIGGEDSTKAAQAVSLRLDNVHTCGGTIIDLKHIVTAAHCLVNSTAKVYDSSRLSVRVGSTNQIAAGKIHYIEKITLHPEYHQYKNDIAVLTLYLPVAPSDKISIIEIANSKEDQPPEGANVVVAGWGHQSSMQNDTPYKLQQKTFTVASDEVCLDANDDVDDSNLCLAHELREGNCIGDAGNGAVYNNKLVGVCSFVVGACGSKYPDVFTDVSYYSQWIQEVITEAK